MSAGSPVQSLGSSPEAGITEDKLAPETGSPEAGSPEAGTPEVGIPEVGTPEAGTPEDKLAVVSKRIPQGLNFDNVEGLLSLVESSPDQDNVDGQEAPDLSKLMRDLLPSEHDGLWRTVLAVSNDYLKGERMTLAEDGQPSDAMAARVVSAVAALLSSYAECALDVSRSGTLTPAFTEALVICQELLLAIPDGHAQSLVARALEKVCSDKFEGCEEFYGGVLMFLIGRCLAPKMTNADVNRFYKVRHLLHELDWEHESIGSLQMQLLQCVASPGFIRGQHGPDLLALIYTVHPGFTAEVNDAVKNCVMYARRSVLEGYASGLLKAWKASEGGSRIQIEHCIQEWVVCAVRSSRKAAERTRILLQELHRHRLEPPINDLLCRAYAPVLWRSLKVANWQVRENAAHLLRWVLPLIPNELGVADAEHELAKQLRLQREALEDPSEPVRRVSVGAACLTLKNYWDALPPAEVAELLTVLMNKCSHDKKAPAVRAAVAEGFGFILQNALSHPTMAAVLPQTNHLLNDRSPIVRRAFIDLLGAVGKCRGVQVQQVVKNEDLLLRLAAEHAEGQAERMQKSFQPKGQKSNAAAAETKATPDIVAKQLAHLMAPSLFQHNLPEQVSRCQYLMQNWPLALFALFAHLDDSGQGGKADRVRLAAALFHFGLRDAQLAGAENLPRPKTVATMLRVVGVLLEGAVAPEKNKKKRSRAGGKDDQHQTPELEKFVYDHIREDDFLHLLKAAHEDDGASAGLREDLLFAVSPLDPKRLPKTADVVVHELNLACRGGGGLEVPRLAALMRAAVRWGLIGDALDPAWERLDAAAERLRHRQPAADDTPGVLAVVEAVFRDQDVRAAILPVKAVTLSRIMDSIASAFCDAWSAGLANLRTPSDGDSPTLLGPAAEVWPRVVGLLVRAGLHLEHRVASPAPPAVPADGSVAGTDPAQDESAALVAVAKQGPTVLEQLALVMTSDSSTDLLQLVEAGNAVDEAGERKAKRSRGVSLPSDIDAVLQVHERVLEALNAAAFLSVLKVKPATAEESTATASCATGLKLGRSLEDCLWRWANSCEGMQSRLSETWVFLGRLAQQTVQCELPTPDVLTNMRRLLDRVTDDLPAEDIEIRKVLQTLFHRFEYEPQLYKFVSELITECEEDTVDAAQSRVHRRVVTTVQDLLPTFRNLHKKVMPEEHKEHESPQDRRRIFASATPQRAVNREDDGLKADDVVAPNAEQVDAQSLSGSSPARSEGQRSFSVRSRSPPVQVDSCASGSATSDVRSRDSRSVIAGMREPSSMDSLFKDCFSQSKPVRSSPAPFVVPDSLDASMSGEDVE